MNKILDKNNNIQSNEKSTDTNVFFYIPNIIGKFILLLNYDPNAISTNNN